MSKYKILPRTYERAKEIDAKVVTSGNPEKKIDVLYKGDVYSIGAAGMMDYPHYLLVDKDLAQQRRKMYLMRHKKNKGIRSYLAKVLLWS